MASYRVLILWIFLFCTFAAAQNVNSIRFSFSITGQDTTTSAAVYDSTGVLVRTLWGNVVYSPGTHTATWDGRLDVNAVSTPGATYTIKLLMDNVIYAYDGHIGGTDREWYIDNKYQAKCGWTKGFAKLTFAGGRGWMACAYNEGANNIMTFEPNDPNYPSKPNINYALGLHMTDDIATDNQWIYLMEHGISATSPQQHNFVTAIDASTAMPVFFSQGTYDTSFVWTNTSVGTVVTATYIDLVDLPSTNIPTGIAVQRSGNILAIAHSSTGVINLFDKKTGGPLGNVTGVVVSTVQPAFTPMAFTSEGLWYVANGHLYLITGLPSSPVITEPITGFQYAAAVGANTLTNGLYVADGGTNQQIYEYAANTHTKMRTLGTLGGYHDCNPTLTHDRLMLDDTAVFGANGTNGSNYLEFVWVAVDDNDHVWVQDQRGQRVQHFDAAGNYVNQIITIHPDYWITTSETMPTRLFLQNWKEYTINYNVPNLPGDPDPALGGNGSWTWSKNWQVCAWGAHGSTPLPVNTVDMYYMIAMEKLSNGKVYGQMAAHNNTVGLQNIFEFPDTGPARNTGVGVPSLYQMGPTGDLYTNTVSGTFPTKTVNVTVKTLTGFDGSNNPIYSAPTNIISTTTNSSNGLLIPGGAGGPWMAGFPSTSGYYPVYWTNGIMNVGWGNGSPTFSPTGAKFSSAMSGLSDSNYMSFLTIGGDGKTWTMEAWLKTTAASNQAAVSYPTVSGQVWMGINTAGQFAFSLDGFNAAAVQSSGISINDGAWHHCVLQMAGGTNASSFVDGTPGAVFYGLLPDPAILGNNAAIGRAATTTGLAWSGSIDEVSIWSKTKYITAFTPQTAVYSGLEPGVPVLFHLDSLTPGICPGQTAPYTLAGNVLNCSQTPTNTYYPHAAAIKAGFPSYAWTTLPEKCLTVPDFHGSFPCLNVGVQGITAIRTEGKSFIFMYAGNWTTYGGQFYHLYEDGLMIGQFGINQAFGSPVRPGNFGNAQIPTTTTYNGDIYLYVGDEATAPAHRWHISNMSSIHEYSGSAILQPNGSVSLTKLF